jgi:hypothetical protein
MIVSNGNEVEPTDKGLTFMARGPKGLDMDKQLASIRAAREAKESGDREAAEFHRETAWKRLDEVLNRLDREDQAKYDEEKRRYEDSKDRPPVSILGDPSRAMMVRRRGANMQLDAGRSVDEIIEGLTRNRTPETKDPAADAPRGIRVNGQPTAIKILDQPIKRISLVPSRPTEPEPLATPDVAPQADDAPESALPPAQDWRAIIADRIVDDDYSFNALGHESGVSPAVIMRFVKGERDIRLATAEKLCAALDLVLVPRESLADEQPD